MLQITVKYTVIQWFNIFIQRITFHTTEDYNYNTLWYIYSKWEYLESFTMWKVKIAAYNTFEENKEYLRAGSIK